MNIVDDFLLWESNATLYLLIEMKINLKFDAFSV